MGCVSALWPSAG